jgi:hypothetical protein
MPMMLPKERMYQGVVRENHSPYLRHLPRSSEWGSNQTDGRDVQGKRETFDVAKLAR